MIAAAAWPWAEATAAARFAQAVEGWHEFYLLAGTAAVTLVGLLFVALSFHLDTLLDDSRAHLLALARQTFGAYLYVLVISLVFLIPGGSARVLGTALTVASAVYLGLLFFRTRTTVREADPSGHDRFRSRRMRMMAIVLLLGLGASLAIAFTHDPGWLPLFVTVVLLQLANAAWTSWDLLVQVGRMKQGAGRGEP